jgi:hypothetical protein
MDMKQHPARPRIMATRGIAVPALFAARRRNLRACVAVLGLVALTSGYAADQPDQDKARAQIDAQIARLRACFTPGHHCTDQFIVRNILTLAPSEVEAILGPAQYRLQVGGRESYYWTVTAITSHGLAPIRLQVIYGECYYREKNSHRKAVCGANAY